MDWQFMIYQTTIIEAYIATNNFDIVCLSEAFLDASMMTRELR